MTAHQITALLALAHDRTEQGRRRLVDQLADSFLDNSQSLSARELEILHEIIDEIVEAGSNELRQHLGGRLAEATALPRQLLIALATDRIEIASPILRRARGLTDADLIEVINQKGVSHARAVAERQAIAAAVVDALVTTGDTEVMCAVAQNLGATISPQAMATLTAAARYAEALRGPIVARPELQPEQANQLYWWLSRDLRQQLLNRLPVVATQAETQLEPTLRELLTRYHLHKNDEATCKQLADWIIERDANQVKSLTQVLRLGYFRLFNMLLANLTQLPLPAIDQVVLEPGGRTLAAMCRALGAEKPVFVSIFLLSRGARGDEQIVHPRELSSALAAFDRVTPQVAQQLLQTWQHDPSYLLKSN